jgi:SAM-dependent methyltransferase
VSSYEITPDFGLLYDAMPAYAARADVAFYLEVAAACGDASRVLDLGAGTGRMTLPLARAGHAVVGVDASRTMLARARQKLAAEAPEVRARVELLEADGRAFHAPGAPFDLAIAPFRVLQHFPEPDDQLRVLASLRAHLVPGGRLALDVFNPNYAALASDRRAELEDTAEQALPDGRSFRRTTRITRVSFVEQVSHVELTYYVRAGTETTRHVQAFPMRWFTPSELAHLVARAGFRLDAIHGGFDRRPLTDEAPELVLLATVA